MRIIWTKKNVKATKRAHDVEDYASSNNLEILHSFNPELQLKSESILTNKLIDLFTQSKGFKFVATLILVLKKSENDVKIKYGTSYSH